jgi:hypothetical protein
MTRGVEGAWNMQPSIGLDATARFESIGIEIPLAEIYAGVEFPDPDKAEEKPEYEM